MTAINSATGLLTARILGPSGRGDLAAVILWPQFIGYILILGLPFALLNAIGTRPQCAREVLGASLLLSTLLGSIGAAAGMLIVPEMLQHYPPDIVRIAQAGLALVPAVTIAHVASAFIQSRQAFWVYTALKVGGPAVTLPALAALAISGKLTPASAAVTSLASGLPVFMWCIVWLWRSADATLKRFRVTAIPLLSYGMRAYGADLIGTFGAQVDRFMVLTWLTSSQLGLYAVALSVSRLPLVLASSINAVALPKMSGADVSETAKIAKRATILSGAMSALSAVIMASAAGFAVPAFYGRSFSAAVPAMRILCGEIVLSATAGTVVQLFLAAGRPELVTVQAALGLAVILPLLAILVPSMGILGAALALLIGAAIKLLISLFLGRRVLHALRVTEENAKAVIAR